MRMPGRLHITWEDDNTLKIETDAGQQTRLLHFGATRPPSGERTLQGYSVAQWGRRRPAGLGFGGFGGFGGNVGAPDAARRPRRRPPRRAGAAAPAAAHRRPRPDAAPPPRGAGGRGAGGTAALGRR